MGIRLGRALGVALIFFLGACGGSSSGVDDATNDNPTTGDGSPSADVSDKLTLSGSVGDGPIVGADVRVVDANGDLVAETSTDLTASYTVTIPDGTALPISVTATGGTDLVTGRPAEFPLRAVALESGSVTLNMTPYTTLGLALAECRGGVDAAALAGAWTTLSQELNLGWRTELVADPMREAIDGRNVATVLLANEALGEILRRAEAALLSSGDGTSKADLLRELGCDLADGAFDAAGSGVDARRAATLLAAAGSVQLEVIAGALQVDSQPAMGLLDDALRAIRPGSGASVTSVVPPSALIEQTLRALAVLQSAGDAEALLDIRLALDEANEITARAMVAAELTDTRRDDLGALAVTVALADQREVDDLSERLMAVDSAPEPVLAFSASETEVVSGAATTLSWASSAAEQCLAAGGWSGPRALEGSAATDALAAPSSFTLSCVGLGGTVERSLTVSVIADEPAPQPTLVLTASSAEVESGATVTLSWSSTDTTTCAAGGAWSGSVPVSGVLSVGPLSQTSTFALTCEGPGGTAQDSVSVSVVDTPPPPAPAPEVSISASATEVESGQPVTLTWSVTDADACTATGSWTGSREISGNETIEALVETSTFGLLCTGSGGTGEASVTVQVLEAPLPTVELSAAEPAVVSGATTTLSWTATDADACVASGGWTGDRDTAGSETTAPIEAATTFVLACTGPGGEAEASVTVELTEVPLPTVELTAAAAAVASGESTTLSWTASEADACTASGGWTGDRDTAGSETTAPIESVTTFVLTCTGAGGEAEASVVVEVNAEEPILSFSASEVTVDSGASTTLSWEAQNADTCVASGGWEGDRGISGTEPVGPLTSGTTFTLTCNGAGGNVVEMIQVDVVSAVGLSWVAPTENVDGSPLEDLAGYRIYYGTSPREYTAEPIAVTDASATSYELQLKSGTYYVAMTALDEQGNESAYSNEVVKAAP